MATPLARRPEPGGASPQALPAGPGTAGYAVPASPRGIGAQAAGALALLTGLWVALSRGSSRCRTAATTPPPST
jgi:hypothetical protein